VSTCTHNEYDYSTACPNADYSYTNYSYFLMNNKHYSCILFHEDADR
jgi:hypothetical protein